MSVVLTEPDPLLYEEVDASTTVEKPVVVIGAGPVGQRVAEDIARFNPEQSVLVLGDEPYQPYDRVKLSSYLSGDVDSPWMPDVTDRHSNIKKRLGTRIARVERKVKKVIDTEGNQWPYSKLILATGSRAYIPPIHGVDLDNVFSFRNMADAEQLKARTISSRHTVIVGGGLLGLEAARAMRRFNTKITIIEQSAWLMFGQLDEQAGQLLISQVKSRGIDVLVNSRVQSIHGDGRVESLVLSASKKIKCDTVVIATGIKPNIEIAKDADLNTRVGILVNQRMQTNDSDIYAIGECAEFQSKVYGLVKPGFEQAAVAASNITQGKAKYSGSQLVTQLKVIESPVFSIGETNSEWRRREVIYEDKTSGKLRKLFINGNRLDAALAIGEWPEFARLQEAVTKNKHAWPWQLARFSQTGSLWPVDEEAGVLAWPAEATICNCMSVSRGDLSTAIDKGCRDVRSLADTTGASTVCGTCRPLLQQMLGAVKVEAVRASRLLTTGAVISLLVIFAFLLSPNLSYSETVQYEWHWDMLWRDGDIKQISGYVLLGLSAVLAFISLPKRARPKRINIIWGDFSIWRAVHVVVGIALLAVLIAHTGLRLGHELNMMLMLTFCGLLLAGAVLSASVGMQHRLPLLVSRTARQWSLKAHIYLLWPLPALLGFHVLKSYWY